jgi:hypothetical protein
MSKTVDETIFDGCIDRLQGRLYGLLCEYEKKGKWEKFLDTIVVEFLGFKEQLNSINYWVILGKLNAARFLLYPYFRATIIDCINLMGKLQINEGSLDFAKGEGDE